MRPLFSHVTTFFSNMKETCWLSSRTSLLFSHTWKRPKLLSCRTSLLFSHTRKRPRLLSCRSSLLFSQETADVADLISRLQRSDWSHLKRQVMRSATSAVSWEKSSDERQESNLGPFRVWEKSSDVREERKQVSFTSLNFERYGSLCKVS